MTAGELLADTLALAVPQAIEEVRLWSPEQRIDYARKHAQIVARDSDTLMFGGKPGEAGRLFSIVAYALACLAFQPGGSRFGEHRWEACDNQKLSLVQRRAPGDIVNDEG